MTASKPAFRKTLSSKHTERRRAHGSRHCKGIYFGGVLLRGQGLRGSLDRCHGEMVPIGCWDHNPETCGGAGL